MKTGPARKAQEWKKNGNLTRRQNGRMGEFCEFHDATLKSLTCSIDRLFCRESQKYFGNKIGFISKIVDFSGGKKN